MERNVLIVTGSIDKIAMDIKIINTIETIMMTISNIAVDTINTIFCLSASLDFRNIKSISIIANIITINIAIFNDKGKIKENVSINVIINKYLGYTKNAISIIIGVNNMMVLQFLWIQLLICS
jgi:hypothetical protein